MRKTETQSGKGFKLQTLRAIEVFFDAIIENGIDAKIYIATEKIGDIYIQTNDKKEIEEVKNFSNPHSINSDAIKNTLINFIDVFNKFKSQNITFSFYSTAKKTETDNNNFEHSILYYLENKEFTTDVIQAVKKTIIPYYKTKYKNNNGFINEISNFSEDDWKSFLSNIIWQFNLPGNQEISEILKQKCRAVIKKVNSDFLTFNGFETFVVYELREQLEKKLEENNFIGDFEFRDFEVIVYKEATERSLSKRRSYGKFKEISECSFSIEPNHFFFTSYENELIEKITNQFLFSNNRNYVFLTGKSSQGKTVLSRQIAYKLEKRNFLILVIELNHKISFSELNLEEISRENNNVFCLLTKSHLNLELINEILSYQDRYLNIKFIFESRIIDRTFEQEAKELFGNESLTEKRLDYHKYEDFKEKYTGIVKKYTSKEVDINLLIKATGRNFLFLSEYLNKADISNLSTDGYEGIDDLVSKKYIERKYDGLKEFAIINQYEIPIKYEQLFEKSNFAELVKENELIGLFYQKDYYNLYHPDFAKLIAESIYKDKKYTKQQILEYEIQGFSKYLTDTGFNETPTIIKSLYSNSIYALLKSLLTREPLKQNILDYYSNPDNFTFHPNSSKPLRDLLKIIPEVCPEVFSEYLKALIIDNDKLKAFFINDSSFIFTLIKISSFIELYLPASFDNFNQKLPIFFSDQPTNIPFSAITFYFNEASKNNDSLFKILRQNYSFEYLKSITEDEEFLNITEGILQLYKLGDYDGFIEEIENILINNSQKTSLERFSEGLQNISQIASIQFTTQIFEKYPKELLISELQKIDIRTALKTVNILVDFGHDKIHKNFRLLKFNNGFQQYNYTEISSILLEADKFIDNNKFSSELINSIDINLLLEKIQKSNPYYIAQSFHLLFKRKGFREFIEKLFYKIPTTFFSFQTNEYDFFKLVEMLHWLKLVDNSGLQISKCLELNYRIIESYDYESLSLERLILIFTYLKGINKNKTRKLIESSQEIIEKKMKTDDYKEIGITLSRLANISPVFANELIGRLLIDVDFLEFLKTQKINIISRTLIELHKVANINTVRLINKLYLSLDKEIIISSTDSIKFDVICHSLNEFLTIEIDDYKRTRKLIWDIGKERLKSAITISSFIGISTGFISLYKVNRRFATELFTYSYEIIINVA